MTGVPPARQCTRATCGREAVKPADDASLCERCLDSIGKNASEEGGARAEDPQSADATPGADVENPTPTDPGPWDGLFQTDPERRTYPVPHYDLEYWMAAGGKGGKQPFAIWGDRDAPADCNEDGHSTADECDCDARWKWGYRGHYRDGATAEMALEDPEIGALTYILKNDEPTLLVDGDDVVDPETGEVHPAFLETLNRFGLTYADLSLSGAGTHAIYRGELPEGVKQASWRIDDEPWGSNDEPPGIEIYDHGRVCVMTGKHVPRTQTEAAEIDAEALGDVLAENDQLPDSVPDDPVSTFEDVDLDGYEPTATETTETTTDIRDIFAALDHVDARDVAEKTIVHRWNDDASTSGGNRAFVPTWGKSAAGTANIVDQDLWQDTGDEAGYGTAVTMALIDAGEISPRNATPRIGGASWFRGVDHLRDLGFDIPRLEAEESFAAERTSVMPVAQILETPPAATREIAAEHKTWPTNDEARDRLADAIQLPMAEGDARVLDAPTSLGKSYTVATTRWGVRDDLTGDRPVVMLCETTDARAEAVAAAERDGGSYEVLLGRTEACQVAAGDYDPPDDDEIADLDHTPVTLQGVAASEVLEHLCSHRGLPFSAAHDWLLQNCDQNLKKLPCCHDGDHAGECDAIGQWEALRDDDGDWATPLIIATHQFAHVPSLRTGTNVIFDEQPDFSVDIGDTVEERTARVRSAVGAFLREIDAPVTSWEAFISLATSSVDDLRDSDAAAERDELQSAIRNEPDRAWYFQERDAHTLAPALARAIFHSEPAANDRRRGKTTHEPPRLDANASDSDGWNMEWVTVVLDDETNDVRTIRVPPYLDVESDAGPRSVIGLDAHPAMPLWQLNVDPSIRPRKVLDDEERRLWRRHERGLRVVQVGDATRPLTTGDYYHEATARALVSHLRAEYGDEFRTAITTKAVRDRLESLMVDLGVDDPDMMHFGNEKSRNDFAGEVVGFVLGCLDPGDEYILDLIAECGYDAHPVAVDCQHCDGSGDCHGSCGTADCHPSTDQCGPCDGTGQQRERGRTFGGPDDDKAAEILASVRENHIAQSAGRYARNPDDPDDTATVYVATDAAPDNFVDLVTPAGTWIFRDGQREIVRSLRDRTDPATAREIADETGVSKRHVLGTLERLVDEGVVTENPRAGPYGATLFADAGVPTPEGGIVDLPDNDDVDASVTAEDPPEDPNEEIVNDHVQDSSTWVLSIRPPDPSPPPGASDPAPDPERAALDGPLGRALSGPDPGDDPPD